MKTVFSKILAAVCLLFIMYCNDNRKAVKRLSSGTIGVLILVPAGKYQRDSNRKDMSYVKNAFYISEKEITYPQFREVAGINIMNNAMNDTPVKFVNWYHALIFCNRLSVKEGLEPVYSIGGSADPEQWMRLVGGFMPMGHSADTRLSPVSVNWNANGYRLPTECEWLWAAMGARNERGGYKKPFSGSTGKNIVTDYAWIIHNAKRSTQPVGTKLPNELGIYDMSGNVMEWCWDWYSEYPSGKIESDSERGQGASAGAGHVVRGGSCWDDLTSLDFRCGSCPFDQDHYVGFRVVRSSQ